MATTPVTTEILTTFRSFNEVTENSAAAAILAVAFLKLDPHVRRGCKTAFVAAFNDFLDRTNDPVAAATLASVIVASADSRPDTRQGKDLLRDLPDEVSVTTYARLANCAPSTVTRMIRQNILPARRLNPPSKRPTYRIPTWALRDDLGLSEPESEFVCPHYGRP